MKRERTTPCGAIEAIVGSVPTSKLGSDMIPRLWKYYRTGVVPKRKTKPWTFDKNGDEK